MGECVWDWWIGEGVRDRWIGECVWDWWIGEGVRDRWIGECVWDWWIGEGVRDSWIGECVWDWWIGECVETPEHILLSTSLLTPMHVKHTIWQIQLNICGIKLVIHNSQCIRSISCISSYIFRLIYRAIFRLVFREVCMYNCWCFEIYEISY